MNRPELENYRNILQEEISKGLQEGSELKIYQAQQLLWENNKKNIEMVEIMTDLASHSIQGQLEKLNEMLGIKSNVASGTSKEKSQILTLNDGNKSMYYGSEEENIDDGGFTNIILLSIALIAVAIIVTLILFA